ncbi:MAG: GntG family PLP-dependent aldolase [Planctomycetota bacterium]|nr:GntG family PLP-dependent aldolase [Planctomycetota bacterium]MDA1105962.1 GntG family PLP-dependent aldolase [Planctomycetota bacterium]
MVSTQRPIDLRSDTVTRPTEAMWEAMRRAPLGDDVLGDDPTVQALEAQVAARVGKEAALFVPSGTMANQLAIRCHTQPGDEIIAHESSHIIHYETGSPAALSGCMVRAIGGADGMFDADAVHASVRDRNIHAPRSRLVVIENTSNRGGGTAWPLDLATRAACAAREHSLLVHIDGARLFNASIVRGYTASEFAAIADTVSICFSKGLGAPVGSALCGPASLIEEARRFRKMFGGGMRQSGLLAAACRYALDHHVDRLADDHANARRLASHIQGMPGVQLLCPPEATPSNMVFFDLPSAGPKDRPAAALCAALQSRGVRLLAAGPARLRAVTHLDVSAIEIDLAAGILASVLHDQRP